MSARVASKAPLLLALLVVAAGWAPLPARADGESVYKASCAACHAAGVLQAPRPGQREDWAPRESQGFDVMLEHALKGFRAMPAKGGNPTLSDAAVESALRYMLVASGFENYAPAKPASAEKSGTAPADEKASTVRVAQKPAANANRFNRLMQPPSEWNLPPAQDGIHDPDNPGTHLLQAPREAFDALSPSRSGNRVDWVTALEEGQIAPRYDRLDDSVRPIVMDLNIVREVKGSMPNVVYPHKQHTEWLDCSNCHPAIFIPQKGANQISMASILLGQKCGVCHGKVAFPVSECRRCHSQPKAAASAGN